MAELSLCHVQLFIELVGHVKCGSGHDQKLYNKHILPFVDQDGEKMKVWPRAAGNSCSRRVDSWQDDGYEGRASSSIVSAQPTSPEAITGSRHRSRGRTEPLLATSVAAVVEVDSGAAAAAGNGSLVTTSSPRRRDEEDAFRDDRKRCAPTAPPGDRASCANTISLPANFARCAVSSREYKTSNIH